MARITEILAGRERPAQRNAYTGYGKIYSYLFLDEICFPVLDGVILCDASPASLNRARHVGQMLGWQGATLRRDCKVRDSFHGGMVMSWREVEAVATGQKPPCLLFLLEPHEGMRNGHNVSLRVDWDQIFVEVVGPGFDASDLQRGHIKAHEIFKAPVFDRGGRLEKLFETDAHEYQTSIQWRREKVFLKYVNKMSAFSLCGGPVPLDWSPPLAYKPIPISKLLMVLRLFRKSQEVIDAAFPRPFVIASSFVEGDRLIFWDIYSGDFARNIGS